MPAPEREEPDGRPVPKNQTGCAWRRGAVAPTPRGSRADAAEPSQRRRGAVAPAPREVRRWSISAQVHYILDEIVIGGLVLDTNIANILEATRDQDKLHKNSVSLLANAAKTAKIPKKGPGGIG